MLAVSLGRPLGIDDVDCDVELPVDLDDEELPLYFTGKPFNRAAPSLMSGFVALIGLYTIAGRLLRQVYALHLCKDDLEPELMAELQSSVDSLDQQLDEWCENLPPCFKLGSYTEQQVCLSIEPFHEPPHMLFSDCHGGCTLQFLVCSSHNAPP